MSSRKPPGVSWESWAERQIREGIAESINQRIRHVNRHAVSGPPSTVMPLDVERVVQRWRAAQA